MHEQRSEDKKEQDKDLASEMRRVLEETGKAYSSFGELKYGQGLDDEDS